MTEFEFESTPETDAMLKQICVKECFVRCKDCKYWELQSIIPPIPYGYCHYLNDNGEGWDTRRWNADDFCSKGEKR